MDILALTLLGLLHFLLKGPLHVNVSLLCAHKIAAKHFSDPLCQAASNSLCCNAKYYS